MPEKRRAFKRGGEEAGEREITGEQPSTAREFTGREGFLAAFDEALGALTPERHSVLVYYGVGGIGKSRLIRRLRGEEPDPPQVPAGVAHAKIDFQEATNRLPEKALERARARLHRQGVAFPTFDIAFAVWWKLAHPNSPLSTSELQFLDEGEIAGDVIAMLADVPVLGLVAKIPRFVGKAGQAVQEWWTKRGQAELAHIAALDDPNKVAAWLPAFFGNDLRAWLAEEEGRRAVLFFDTHEALWEERGSGESGAPPDDWLREWAAHLEGVLVVIGSRNKLRWTEPDPTWEGLIEQHLMGGLSPEDAVRFLEKAGVAEADVRTAIAEKSRGVPQYLDLAASTYEEIQKAEGPPPHPDEFDENLEALLERFLAYVKDQRRQALFVLSVPETFDYARFRDLMRTFAGGVMATRKGLQSITQFTFVDVPEPGRYALHALVREALAAMDDPDDRAAVHRHLFEQAKAALEDVDLRAITDAERQALREGVAHGPAVLEAADFIEWYSAAEKPFEDAAEQRLLLPLRGAVFTYAMSGLGPSHPNTLTFANNLGVLLKALGNYAVAEALYRSTLVRSEHAHGPDHPNTLALISNLGMLLHARGDYAGAEVLYRRALKRSERVHGPDHPNTLSSVNNFGLLLQDCGDYAGAEQFLRRALERNEHAHGPDHPNTISAVNNLGLLLQDRGNYAEAEVLLRRALEDRERLFGPDHPSTLSSINNLGSLLHQVRGDYAGAEPLLRRALKGSERVHGPNHPETLTSANNLAVLLHARGDYAEAEALHRRALEGRERLLGPDHPDTLSSVNNLGGLLQARSDYAGAEVLYRRALEGCKRRFGPRHPYTKICQDNLTRLLQAR